MEQLYKVSDIYNRVLGTKKTYNKTLLKDLTFFKINFLKTGKGDTEEYFVLTSEVSEQIEAYLSAPSYGKSPAPANEWKAGMEARMDALESSMALVMEAAKKAIKR